MGKVSHPPLYRKIAVDISWKAMIKNITKPTNTPFSNNGNEIFINVFNLPAPETSDASSSETSSWR